MRSQVINMIGYAGDITTAKSRLGIYSALVMVKGGTSGTAIKVVTCSTSDGEFVDYVKLADGASDIVKGFYVDLSGADKYIKVTGATYADVVFGDCDFDPKSIVTTGSVPAPSADLDNNKTATINVSTYTEPVEITPTAGKDGMKKATVTLSNIPSGGTKLFAWKTEDVSVYTLTENPSVGDIVLYKPYNDNIEGAPFSTESGITTVKSVTENQIETTYELNSSESVFTRYSDGDIEL